MKITRLQSNNVMRLTAVDITPDGNMILIGGKNGAGKSSVLGSIAMALGGANLVPTEPIRTGETEGSITVNLDDLVVTRKFSRDKIHTSTDVGDGQTRPCSSTLDISTISDNPNAAKQQLPCDCVPTFGETRSTLVVTNRDGAKYPSPQAMLDKLLGKLTFDPLGFSRDEPKRQDDTLRKLVNLDTSAIEEKRKEAFANRAIQKKTYEIKQAQLLALPKFDGVPEVEVSMADISADMDKALALKASAVEALKAVDDHAVKVDIATRQVSDTGTLIAKLEQELAAVKQRQNEHVKQSSQLNAETETVRAASKTASDATATLSVDNVRTRLSAAETTNTQVRANQKRLAAMHELDTIEEAVALYDRDVKTAENEKRTALESAAFPVPGLGLNDDGVTFGGLPFAQASTSEQLRVSVAIGLALNPTLKVLLIRSGNLLDEDSLKLVAEQAAAADAQLWVEYVTSDAKDVQVMIEDGKVQ